MESVRSIAAIMGMIALFIPVAAPAQAPPFSDALQRKAVLKVMTAAADW